MAWWSAESLPKATRDKARLVSDLEKFGYCLIDKALESPLLERVFARIDEQAEAEKKFGLVNKDDVQKDDDGNQWVYLLVNKGDEFLQLLENDLVRSVVASVLGQNYLLSEMAASITRPGNKRMGLHIDQWWLPVPQVPSTGTYKRIGDVNRDDVKTGEPTTTDRAINPPVVCNVMFMVTDFTLENGATRIVPGSHLSGANPTPTQNVEAVNATGKAGTAVVFEGRTWHSADLNVSNRPRYGITTFYSGPQFRQMTNFTYGTSRDVADNLNDDLSGLLGFRPWRGYGSTGDPAAKKIIPADKQVGRLRLS